MTASAPVLRREVDLSPASQLTTLNQAQSPKESEFLDFRRRSEKNRALFNTMGLSSFFVWRIGFASQHCRTSLLGLNFAPGYSPRLRHAERLGRYARSEGNSSDGFGEALGSGHEEPGGRRVAA